MYNDDVWIFSQVWSSRLESSSANLTLKNEWRKRRNVGHRCGACHKTSDAKVRKIGQRNVKKSVFKS